MSVTLCGASRLNRKFYFNPEFDRVPKDIREHLREICVLFVEDAGGIFTMEFNDEGRLMLVVRPGETDSDLDEIAAELRIRTIQEDEAELMGQLELFYRVFIEETFTTDEDT